MRLVIEGHCFLCMRVLEIKMLNKLFISKSLSRILDYLGGGHESSAWVLGDSLG